MNTQNEHTASESAMRAARRIFPTGRACYMYDDPKQVEAAHNRDWQHVARIIDEETANAHDALVEALADAHDFIDAIVDGTSGAGRIDENSIMRLGERLKTTARKVQKRTSAALALAKEGK